VNCPVIGCRWQWFCDSVLMIGRRVLFEKETS